MKILAAGAIMIVASLPLAGSASADGKRLKRSGDSHAIRDCTPFNGPFGYYGNPWCDGGYKYAEDYAPGTGPNLDLLQLPQIRRYRNWWE
jgi:hypothetical protein